ncbi:MAG: aerobic-type carbon monoxide dehydrogenase, large subunit CoxL/CutL-like protein [Clostridiales bacterium]|jgi:CO/xanthine dehydrogenase Mo-binding subunit|nr:aerobic-type carbon monoxide dehydrogenase, large subunit CoxL/CutL-like protein [Clostridiales bacterium]
MKKRGTGYSTIFYGTGYGNGFPDESRATAELSCDGKITVYVGVADVGQGGISIMWQIAVETLGISKELVTIKNNSTSLMRDSGTAAASRQTYNTGNAVLVTCKMLRDNMELAINEDNKLKIEDSSLPELYKAMIDNKIETRVNGYFKATTSQVDLETGQGNPYWPYSFGAQRVTVEVDDETGKVNIIDIVALNDAGKVINPVLAEGQAQGGTAMGIGYAIMEEVELNNGTIKNKNFSDYIIPTSMDMPNIRTVFVEEDEESGPYGAKGLGEPAMIPTAPAIINAIYDAIGVRIYDLPATCEKVLLAIKNKIQNDVHILHNEV